MEAGRNLFANGVFVEPSSLEEAQTILQTLARAVTLDGARSHAQASESDELLTPATASLSPNLSQLTSVIRRSWDKKVFESLVESAPDALIITGDDGNILLVNAQTEKLFGYRRAELLGQPIEILVPARFRARHVAHRNRYFGQPEVRPMGRSMDLSGRHKNGHEFPVEISLSPLKTDEGVLVTSTVRDITDRKRLEARYRTLVEGIPAVTFMASLEGGVSEIYVSPHVETMLGFTQQEWLGDPFLWFRQLHPDDRDRWGQEFARTCASGVQFRSEYRFLNRNGKIVWVHGEATVVRDDFGKPLFLQGIAFDITESKNAEATLRRSADELEQVVQTRTVALREANLRAESASRSRAEFLANMSHEIRTPLNAIIGFTDLMRKKAESSDEERIDWLNTVYTSGKHLLGLINDILDLSKVDAGKLEIERIEFSPASVASEVMSILRPRAKEKGLQLELAYETLVPSKIHGDPTRLRQLLMNLVGNSLKFTEKGGVSINVRLNQAETSKLAFAVVDTGIGIPEDKLTAIFDPFTQADASTTRKFGGTGLGLAISKKLVEAMGGKIKVTSRLNQGSTFAFEIDTGPLDGVTMLEQPVEALVSRRREVAPMQSIALPYRMLVVDDGEANRALIRLMLERAGARVKLATNGQEGLDAAMAETFDIILMDMQMPVMDGYTAARELRSRGVTLPIVALTARAMKGDEKDCLDAGCTGYLTKPIDRDTLVRYVKDLLNDLAPTVASDAPQPAPPPTRPAEPVAKPTALAAAAVAEPRLTTTLPMDDEEFRKAVLLFVEGLGERLNAMATALQEGNLEALAQHAHWIQGAGGTAGFPDFTEPAHKLEKSAKAGLMDDIEKQLDQIEHLLDRIEV